MKQLLIILCVAASLAACQTADKKTGQPLTEDEKNKAANDSANFTTLQWLDSSYLDMGKVKEGTMVEVNYRFKNSGDKNLVIESVSASCGCTVPEKPEQAFAPGEEGVIKAKFDSKSRTGVNQKNVTVIANTKPSKEHLLQFKVEVTN
jgi:hypothetical protein